MYKTTIIQKLKHNSNMNQNIKKIFDRDVEEITTFPLVATTKHGNLLFNEKTWELFLERSSTKQLIPLGSKLYQLSENIKKIFDRQVKEVTTFLLVSATEQGNLLMNKSTEELFLETPSTKQLIPLGSKLYQLARGTYIKDLPVYPLD